MIAVLMPCLFLCNTCACAELRKQERAQKLCSVTLNQFESIAILKFVKKYSESFG